MTRDRDYASIAKAINGARGGEHGPLTHRRFVDLLWEGLSRTDVSWLGIYLVLEDAPPDRRLVLGCCRDRPACSPIGLHGVCGRSVVEGRPILVRDVFDLGPDYIACDPRDRSEVVVPLADARGCWGVLDLDSHAVGAFEARDIEQLSVLIEAAGLLRHPGPEADGAAGKS